MDRPSRPMVRRRQASEYFRDVWGISLSTATLAKLACIGGGPKFYKDGPWPLYNPDHLDEYAVERLGEARANTAKRATSREAA